MSRLRTTAVVLRRWPWSESSLVVHMLTPESGVLAALSKGAYKLKSGQFGVLDTWALIEVELGPAGNQGMHTLYRCQLVERFGNLARAVDSLAAAGLIAEIAELAAPSGSPAGEPFLYLVTALQQLTEEKDPLPVMTSALSRGLDLLGLRPRLDDETPTRSTSSRWLALADGAVLAPGAERPASAALPISTPVLEALRTLQAAPDRADDLDRKLLADCLTILGEFLSFHLERPPRAWKVIQQRHPVLVRPS